jgi:acetyl esterase/lipase
LDLWIPRNRIDPVPAALMFHGGGWREGVKERILHTICQPYLRRGYAVVNVEYRKAPHYAAPAAVEDALSAARWLRANGVRYGLDLRRVVACGESAGGHLALMTVLSPEAEDRAKSLTFME